MNRTIELAVFFQRKKPFLSPNLALPLSSGAILLFIIILLSGKIADSASKLPPTQAPYVINNHRYYPIPSASGFNQKGTASWYGKDFHGQRTSNGEIYNMYSMTAAHKTLPMNTVLMVKNLHNGRKTIVRVNDRGPFVKGRIIDLSYSAAKNLDLLGKGVAKVKIIALTEDKASYPDLSSGEFYVQIGAFAQKINAVKLQRRFTDAGHTTVIQKYYGTQSILHRVQVYAGKTLNNARRTEKALHDHGYVGAFVIAR